MNMPSEESVPSVVHLDGLEAFNLEPEEAFVFSRVNGSTSLKEIAQMLGYDVARVWRLLMRSTEAGFIRFEERAAKPAPKRPTGKVRSILDQLDQDEKDSALKKIPRDRRKDVLLRYEALPKQNHYEVLGLKVGDSEKLVKDAYFRLVKDYHPDRFFGQELGHYGEKLEVIFGAVTKAFEQLTDPVRKKGYDRSLTEKEKPKSSKKEEEETPSKISTKTLVGQLAKAKHYFEMAKEEERKENERAAAQFYQMAYQLDPKNPEYERARNRTRTITLRHKSDEAFSRGIDALNRGDPAAATVLLEEALQANPRKRECYRYLATLYLERKGSLSRAKELGLRAVEFYPDDSAVHTLMGKIYRELKIFDPAKKEFKLAVKLDKTNETAKKALAELERK